jgi:hypothetical protein
MKLIACAAAGLAFFTMFVVWLQTTIQYRIGSKHMKILCLNVPLRKIDLTDIKRVSKRKPSGLAEYWYSTTNPKHRVLTIQRHTGFRKNIVISPRNRYIFMSDLKNAVHRVKPDANLDNFLDQPPESAPPTPSAPTGSESIPRATA